MREGELREYTWREQVEKDRKEMKTRVVQGMRDV